MFLRPAQRDGGDTLNPVSDCRVPLIELLNVVAIILIITAIVI
jgi:hypothetical protein